MQHVGASGWALMSKLPHDKTLEKMDTLGAQRRGVRAIIAESACVLSSCGTVENAPRNRKNSMRM